MGTAILQQNPPPKPKPKWNLRSEVDLNASRRAFISERCRRRQADGDTTRFPKQRECTTRLWRQRSYTNQGNKHWCQGPIVHLHQKKTKKKNKKQIRLQLNYNSITNPNQPTKAVLSQFHHALCPFLPN